jgi:hypothetical protein
MISAPSILSVKYHLNLRARDTQKVHEQPPLPFLEDGCIFIQPKGGAPLQGTCTGTKTAD